MAVIEIENLTKDYEIGFFKKRRVRALDDLTLAVDQGEIFGFLGPNGAGKTTTIKLLMRLIYPTSGRARILGRDINDISMHQLIGYLPEQPYFYDYLTARELLEYCAELFGMRREARRKRAEELLRLVGLEEKSWTKQLRRLSKGMTQRVGRSLDERDTLRRMLGDFQRRTGKCPGSWRETKQDLRADANLLRFDQNGTPVDPSGVAYRIDPNVCEAILGSTSKIARR